MRIVILKSKGETMRTIGERLIERRQKARLTQAELSTLAGVHQGLISRIEQGKVIDPGATVVRRLARTLGVTSDWLIGMHEDEDEYNPVLPAHA
jgi:transcriptional regulator with XRE-family HTH domain